MRTKVFRSVKYTSLKVKNDHRRKFSNLSNWKEEAWKKKKKKSGLQRDFNTLPPRYRCDALPTELWSHTQVEHRTGITEVTGSNPVEALFSFLFFFLFFQASSFQVLKLETLLRWLFFTFIYNRSSNMSYFVYTSHKIHFIVNKIKSVIALANHFGCHIVCQSGKPIWRTQTIFWTLFL